MKFVWTISLLLSSFVCDSQNSLSFDTLRKAYNADMKLVSDEFSANYDPKRASVYSLNPQQFLKKIDSLKQPFLKIADKYAGQFQVVAKTFIPDERRDISLFFDRMIVDYPYLHENYTGKQVTLPKTVQTRLKQHLKYFNNPQLLSSKDFISYAEAVLRHQTTTELRKAQYKKSDNKRLDAYLNIIPAYFTNRACKEFWQHHYLFAHLENFGSKNTAEAVKSFLSTCTNSSYTKPIDSIYRESVESYKGHLVKTYKTVNGTNLDLHIFLPDTSIPKTKRPVMIYFHGGSWTEGTPEWDFFNCANFAKKGWVAVAVEYRIADRHETTPFEAVKDARSAIRWLRANAAQYEIDTSRIVASGNSAGGHLVLATAMANEINENTDNLNIGASPNILLINSGVFDLTADASTAWISKGLTNKSFIQKISPQHLLRKGLPPMLIIHGTNDQSVNYTTARSFAESMKKTGNDIEFHTLEGAHHYIWYDRRFSVKVAEMRKAFLKKYGYE